MTLAEIPRPSAVFVDANVFIYHFTGQSKECSDCLARIETGDLRGLTAQTTLLEVAHRLMVIEAIERGLRAGSSPAARLTRRSQLVRELSRYYFSTLKIPQMGIEILSIPMDFLTRSQEYRQTYGLLVNDSLIPLHMRTAGITYLASADGAFDRIPWIRRAFPSDVPREVYRSVP